MSMTTPFSDSEKAAMQKLLNDIYAQFTTKAAAGRKMEVDKLEKLARGRIYTGLQAKELGLVDEIGTLTDAIAYAKKAAGLDPDKKLERLDLPKPTSPFESLLGPLDSETQLSDALLRSLWRRVPASLQGPLRDLQAFETLAHEPALTVMPFRVIVR
jgi:protease-4